MTSMTKKTMKYGEIWMIFPSQGTVPVICLKMFVWYHDMPEKEQVAADPFQLKTHGSRYGSGKLLVNLPVWDPGIDQIY